MTELRGAGTRHYELIKEGWRETQDQSPCYEWSFVCEACGFKATGALYERLALRPTVTY